MFVIMGVFISVLYRKSSISNFSVLGVYCTLSFLSMGVFISVRYTEFAVSIFSVVGVYCTLYFYQQVFYQCSLYCIIQFQ